MDPSLSARSAPDSSRQASRRQRRHSAPGSDAPPRGTALSDVGLLERSMEEGGRTAPAAGPVPPRRPRLRIASQLPEPKATRIPPPPRRQRNHLLRRKAMKRRERPPRRQ